MIYTEISVVIMKSKHLKKGDAYVYWYLDSTFNNHQVEPIEGQPIIFNEEQFYNNFTLDPNYEKKH